MIKILDNKTPYHIAYDEGYRKGRADALIGFRSYIALTSPTPGYAQGYLSGWGDVPHNERF